MNRDWYDFKAMHGNISGAREAFEQTCAILFKEIYANEEVLHVNAINDDEGIDTLVGNIEREPVIVIQSKFFLERIEEGQKQQISKSFKRVILNRKYKIKKWILCIPSLLTINEIRWWKNWKEQREKEYFLEEDVIQLFDGDTIIQKLKEKRLYDIVFNIENNIQIKKCSENISLAIDILKQNSKNYSFLVESEMMLKKIVEFDKIFVKHYNYYSILDHIQKKNACIISGIPGIGKTTTAGAICLSFILNNYEFYFVRDNIDEIYSVLKTEKKQIFFFDDFLGSVSLNRKISDSDIRKLGDLIDYILNSSDKKIVFTSREYILNQATIEFDISTRLLPKLKKLIIEFDDYTINEKAKILFNHLKKRGNNPEIKRQLLYGDSYEHIILHENFSPRIVEWMTSDNISEEVAIKGYIDCFLYNLKNPVKIWECEFKKISKEAIDQLYILLLHNGRCRRDELFAEYVEVNEREVINPETIQAFNNGLIEIKDTMLSIYSFSEYQVIRLANPSVFDYLIYYLEENNALIDHYFPMFKNFETIYNFLMLALERDKDYIIFKYKYPKLMNYLNLNNDAYLTQLDSSFVEYKKQENNIIKGVIKIHDTFGEKSKNKERIEKIIKWYLSENEMAQKESIIECLKYLCKNHSIYGVLGSIDKLDKMFLSIDSINDIAMLFEYIKLDLGSKISNEMVVNEYINKKDVIIKTAIGGDSIDRIDEYCTLLEELSEKTGIDTGREIRILDKDSERISSSVERKETVLDEEKNVFEYEDEEYDYENVKKMFRRL